MRFQTLLYCLKGEFGDNKHCDLRKDGSSVFSIEEKSSVKAGQMSSVATGQMSDRLKSSGLPRCRAVRFDEAPAGD
jgi:hypothetical protein